ARARLNPAQVGYVEAHGTGTALGDPIELEALQAVFSTDAPRRTPLVVGAVKARIGHLEAAAGVAGVLHVLAAMDREEIPTQCHFRHLNRNIQLDDNVRIATEPIAWPRDDRPRIAGVSGFSFGGSNVHLVIEEGPPTPPAAPANPPERLLLALSARERGALRQLAHTYAQRLQDSSARDARALCATALTGRSQLPRRLAATGGTAAALSQTLAHFAATDQRSEHLAVSTADTSAAPRLGFFFCDPGVDRPGHAGRLYDQLPIYRATVDAWHKRFAPHLPRPLQPFLCRAGESGGEPCMVQAACFTHAMALCAWWRALGLMPRVVAGHGLGEYAASVTACYLTEDDAAQLVSDRAEHIARRADDAALARIAALQPGTSCPPLVGPLGPAAELATPVGWVRPTRAPADYRATLEALSERGITHLIEIAPDARPSVPTAPAELVVLPSLRPDRAVPDSLLDSLAQLFAAGVSIRWSELTGDHHRLAGDLPAYPFQRQKYWLDSRERQESRAVPAVTSRPARWVASGHSEPLLDALLATDELAGVDRTLAARLVAAVRRVLELPKPDAPAPDHAYHLIWRAIEPNRLEASPGSARAPLPRRWLVVDAKSAFPQVLERALIGNDGSLHAAPTLFVATLASPDPTGVIFVWPRTPPSDKADHALEACKALLQCIQTLCAVTAPHPPRLWLVSSGAAAPAAGDAVDPVATSLWSMARTFQLEHPERWGGMLDIEPWPTTDQIPVLRACWDSDDIRDGLAVRGARVWAPRLVPVPSTPSQPAPLAPQKTYLITGGLGGLGLELAHALARAGARHLVLTARRGPGQAARARLQALR
ncbi:MAG: ketoacyl-synthetase C-terminal extension domain-containing protein, partial [Myxococcota bacterium]